MNILKNIFLNGKYTLCFSQLIIIPIVIASMFTNITDVSTALEGEKTWFSSLVLVHVFKKKNYQCGMNVLYLKGFGQGSGSFIFQAVPPRDKHSQFEWSSIRWWLSVALNQSFSQDLHKPYSTVMTCDAHVD